MSHLNQITVCETASAELTATGATVAVRVAGRSFFTGREAFKKAAEVAELVAALHQVGVPESDIRLAGVSSEVGSGVLTKSSAATYDLRIECDSLDKLGPIVAAIAAQKNAQLSSIAWKYPDFDQSRRDVLQAAVRQAKEVARQIADALGVPLEGVHFLNYKTTGADTELRTPQEPAYLTMSREKKQRETLPALDLSHTTTLRVTVAAGFIVGDG